MLSQSRPSRGKAACKAKEHEAKKAAAAKAAEECARIAGEEEAARLAEGAAAAAAKKSRSNGGGEWVWLCDAYGGNMWHLRGRLRRAHRHP